MEQLSLIQEQDGTNVSFIYSSSVACKLTAAFFAGYVTDVVLQRSLGHATTIRQRLRMLHVCRLCFNIGGKYMPRESWLVKVHGCLGNALRSQKYRVQDRSLALTCLLLGNFLLIDYLVRQQFARTCVNNDCTFLLFIIFFPLIFLVTNLCRFHQRSEGIHFGHDRKQVQEIFLSHWTWSTGPTGNAMMWPLTL